MPAATQKLTPNRARIAEAILYLVARAEHKKSILTQYDIVKSLWIADTNHLESYGRPITFDNYSALKDGPIPSEAYDMLKPNYSGAKYLEEWPLWDRMPYKDRAFMYLSPARQPDLKRLSKSDVEELDKAMEIVFSLGFEATRALTHRHPAYVAAWNARGDKKAADIDYLALIENDKAVFEDLVFSALWSKHTTTDSDTSSFEAKVWSMFCRMISTRPQ